jgi:hypothetical protein
LWERILDLGRGQNLPIIGFWEAKDQIAIEWKLKLNAFDVYQCNHILKNETIYK